MRSGAEERRRGGCATCAVSPCPIKKPVGRHGPPGGDAPAPPNLERAIDPGQCRIRPSTARVPPLSALIVLGCAAWPAPVPSNGCAPPTSRAIIGLLAGEGPMSRADLVRASGLSRTTVSSLVAELIRAGQVTETDRPGTAAQGRQRAAAGAGPAQRAGGRRGRGRHRPRARPGRRGRPARCRARRGARRWSTWTPTAPRCSTRPPRWSARADRAGRARPDRPAGGRHVRARPRWTGGPPGSGPASCRGWQGLLPGEELERRLGVPCHADNDANLGALAELHHGSARGRHDVST